MAEAIGCITCPDVFRRLVLLPPDVEVAAPAGVRTDKDKRLASLIHKLEEWGVLEPFDKRRNCIMALNAFYELENK